MPNKPTRFCFDTHSPFCTSCPYIIARSHDSPYMTFFHAASKSQDHNVFFHKKIIAQTSNYKNQSDMTERLHASQETFRTESTQQHRPLNTSAWDYAVYIVIRNCSFCISRSFHRLRAVFFQVCHVTLTLSSFFV